MDDRAGFNWYDYSARMKDDWSFTTINPHSENYYSLSPKDIYTHLQDEELVRELLAKWVV